MQSNRIRLGIVMKKIDWIIGIIAITAVLFVGSAFGKTDYCIQCHSEMDDSPKSPAVLIKSDIHYQRGLSCADCHGGDASKNDAEEAMSPKKGFVGKPSYRQIPNFCGRCHSDVEYMRKYEPKLRVDQLQLYWTSNHGKMLKKGDRRVAQCVSCHGVHNIKSIKNPQSPVNKINVPATCAKCHADKKYMHKYNIPTDQYAKYSRSVHGKLLLEKRDTSAPACNSCHGNHGATPPGLASISAACGECHGINRDLYNKSPHKEPWAELGYRQCVQCHDYHLIKELTDEDVGVGNNAVCIDCHDKGDGGYEAAFRIKASLDSLKYDIRIADSILAKAKKSGADVGELTFELGEASKGLIEARNRVHSFSPDVVGEVTSASMQKINIVIELGNDSLKALWHRKIGLILTSFLILLVAGLLYLKIRRVEKKK